MQTGNDTELLSEAFENFEEASRKLEQQYLLLGEKLKVLNREISEKNRSVERTRRLVAMGEMAAKIAHEIRNPLGSISIFAAILCRELAGDEERRRLAEHISKGVRALDNILSNMLLFARYPEPRLESMDIREVIEDTLNLTSGYAKRKVIVRKDFSGSTILPGDRGLLKQLFLNLFLNSFDAMEDGGELRINTWVSRNGSGALDITVEDNGCGIPEEYQDRIFDPFFTTKDRGTGLGLAIVATIVGAHKGEVQCSSVPGRGTVFSIRLPLSGGS